MLVKVDTDAMVSEALEVSDMLLQASASFPSYRSSSAASSSGISKTLSSSPLEFELHDRSEGQHSIQHSLFRISDLSRILYFCSVDKQCAEFMKKYANRKSFQSVIQKPSGPDKDSSTKTTGSADLQIFLQHLKSVGIVPGLISSRAAIRVWSRERHYGKRNLSTTDFVDENKRKLTFEDFQLLLFHTYKEGFNQLIVTDRPGEIEPFFHDVVDGIQDHVDSINSSIMFQMDLIEKTNSSYQTQTEYQKAKLQKLESAMHSLSQSEKFSSAKIESLQKELVEAKKDKDQLEVSKIEAIDCIKKLRKELNSSEAICCRLHEEAKHKQKAYDRLLDELKVREETCLMLDQQKSDLVASLNDCRQSRLIESSYKRELVEKLRMASSEFACSQQDSAILEKELRKQLESAQQDRYRISKVLEIHQMHEQLFTKTICQIENHSIQLEIFLVELREILIAVENCKNLERLTMQSKFQKEVEKFEKSRSMLQEDIDGLRVCNNQLVIEVEQLSSGLKKQKLNEEHLLQQVTIVRMENDTLNMKIRKAEMNSRFLLNEIGASDNLLKVIHQNAIYDSQFAERRHQEPTQQLNSKIQCLEAKIEEDSTEMKMMKLSFEMKMNGFYESHLIFEKMITSFQIDLERLDGFLVAGREQLARKARTMCDRTCYYIVKAADIKFPVEFLSDHLQRKLNCSEEHLQDAKLKLETALGECERLSNELSDCRGIQYLQATRISESEKGKQSVSD
eukprot:754757-Hanusia_phi.AAC.4